MGLFLGLCATLFVFLEYNAIQRKESIVLPEELSRKTPLAKDETPTKPHFEFYDKLPKMTLDITSPAPTTPEIQKPQEALRYFLQIAAFKDENDAESLKARLAFLGVQANISSKEAQDSIWHRVQLGPFEDRKEVLEMEVLLQTHGFSGLLIRQDS